MKVCRICHLSKPLDDFYRNRAAKDRRTARCIDCLSPKLNEKRYAEVRSRGTKKCSICKEYRSLHCFYKSKNGIGLSPGCRRCYLTQTRTDLSPNDLAARIREVEWRAEKKSKGLCTRCGKYPLSSGSACAQCIEKRRISSLNERNQRIAKGLCGACGKVPKTRSSLCDSCHNTSHQRKLKQRRELRNRVLDYLGSACSCCGESIRQFLNIDHANGDGSHERKRTHVRRMHEQILAGLRPDLRLLCWNCNLGRELNGGTCPHETVDKSQQVVYCSTPNEEDRPVSVAASNSGRQESCV